MRAVTWARLWCFAVLSIGFNVDAKNVYVWPGTFVSSISTNNFHYRDGYSGFLRKCQEGCDKLGYFLYFDCKPNYEIKDVRADVIVIFDLLTGTVPLHNLLVDRELAKAILFAWEPPTVNSSNFGNAPYRRFFDKIYTIWDDLVDGVRHCKFYEPQSTFKMPANLPKFSRRKFCVVMTSPKASRHPRELYSSRVSAISRFCRLDAGSIEMWGEAPSLGCIEEHEVVPERYKLGQCHKGYAPSKLDCYRDYKFAICYENMRGLPGYVTSEKFMFCLLTGCVPVYWGANNITDYVAPDCFIDRRDFNSDMELYNYLNNMSEIDHERYVRSAKNFMNSPWPLVFSQNNFVDIFLNAIDPEYDREAVFTSDELTELRCAKKVMYELGHLPIDECARWVPAV